MRQVYDSHISLQMPDELLFRKGLLHLILVDAKGNTYEGNFNVDGNEYCPLVTCFFCTSVFRYLSCLPGNLQYLIYLIFFILTGILLIYLKALFSLAWNIIKCFVYFGIFLYFCFKGSIRISMLYGILVGDRIGFMQIAYVLIFKL